MSEKEPKTTENPEIAETHVAVPLQPESASTGEFQQDEEIAYENKETAQTENVRKQDAGKIQHEDYTVDQSRNETKDQSESYSDSSKPVLEKTESDVLTSLDTDSYSGPSEVSYDKISDTSESPNCSKRRSENRDDFVIQAERMIVDEVPKSDIQNLSDTNKDESKIAVPFRNLDPLSKMESETYENKNISPIKENKSPPVHITEEFRTDVSTEKDNDQLTRLKEYKSSSGYDILSVKSSDENTIESKLERQYNLETGRVMSSIRSPVAQRKGKSNIYSCNTQESERDRRPMVVKDTPKSTGLNQPGNQRTGQFENKDKSEANGGGSQNPSLNRFRGVVYTGVDKIEYLPEESSKPEILTTPGSPAELEPPSTLESLKSVYILELLGCTSMSRLSKSLLDKLGQKMAKAPIFYCISIVVIIICMIVLIWTLEDYDICACIIFSFLVCIIITLCKDRGDLSKTDDDIKEECCSARCVESCKKLCISSACCGRKPQNERHSQYYHLEQKEDSAFKHEITDVSNIDPEDYQHMKFVDEQEIIEIIEAESPDYPIDSSPVNVYGHASGNLEEFARINENCSQVVFKKATESPHKMKSKSSSASLKLPKSYEVEESGGNHDISEFHEAKELKNRLITHDEALPKPVKIGFAEERDVENEHEPEEFICEHTGKNIACSCSLYAPKE